MKYKRIAVVFCMGVFSACAKPTQPALDVASTKQPVFIAEKKLVIDDIKSHLYYQFNNSVEINIVTPIGAKGYLKFETSGLNGNLRLYRDANLTAAETGELLNAFETAIKNISNWKPNANATSHRIRYLINGIGFMFKKNTDLSVSLGIDIDGVGVTLPEESLHKIADDLASAKVIFEKN